MYVFILFSVVTTTTSSSSNNHNVAYYPSSASYFDAKSVIFQNNALN